MKRIIGMICAALSLAACAALPRLETPQLSIVNVQMLQGNLWEQTLRVRMRVQNPNDRALPISGLTYALEVADQELARAVSDRSFTVPALGESEFDMTVRTNMALTLLRLAGSQGSDVKDAIPYRMHGKISLSEGLLRSIPFQHRGKFELK